MNNNLRIDLDPRFDKEEEVYFIGRLNVPVTIDLEDGITFLVFLSKSGEEELQIAPNDKENITFSKHSIRGNKMKIPLSRREDKDGETFYVCKVRHPGKIKCLGGSCFMIFVSRQNSEELQITGDIYTHSQTRPAWREDRVSSKEVEILRR